MSNMSKYQHNYWYPKIAEKQHGEYCVGCGISPDSNWKDRKFTGLRIDKINNDGNHTIVDNTVNDFQLMCASCNLTKNHPRRPVDNSELQMTASEKKNHAVEKPLMDWLFQRIQNGERTSFKFFVAEGSYLFDISPKTIKERYYIKYFEAPSAPFETYYESEISDEYVRFKDAFSLKNKNVHSIQELDSLV